MQQTEFRPITLGESPRFVGIKSFMRLPQTASFEGADFAIVGVPFDSGASFRTGQRHAPEAIRSMSVLLRDYNPALDIAIFDYCGGLDYGDVPVVPGYFEDTYSRMTDTLAPLLEAGIVPFALGGDHSVSLGELRAIAAQHGPAALVHFDAHPDTEENFLGQPYYHGTPFRRAMEEHLLDVEHSIQVGIRGSSSSKAEYDDAFSLGLDVITTDMIRENGIPAVIQRIQERVGTHKAFVSVDIDVVDPAYAPGTGTLEVGGITSWEALTLVRGLRGLHIAGGDMVEVLPANDPSAITASLAANIVYELISLHALMKRDISHS